jgi:hypothetical protein
VIWRPARAPIEGKLLVVGGQCRKVGKTALCVDLLRLMDDMAWIAVKITPHTESGCPVRGANCGCPPREHTFSIREEKSQSTGKDTSRYLQAGATQAFWVQTKADCLADALDTLNGILKGARRVLIESDAIARYWRPELSLLVVDPRKTDFKLTARVRLASADILVFRAPLRVGMLHSPMLSRFAGTPQFLQPFGYPLPSYMQKFVRQRFQPSGHQTTRYSNCLALVVDP